tara:strand:+ start:786 stop:1955 length:1170 start_codon:yes stop_codon:yes gene_type:complete
MINKLYLRLLLIIIFFCFFNGKVFAGNKHKILVTDFTDPPRWNKPFSPGKVLKIRLKNQFAKDKQVSLLPDKSLDSTEVSGSLMKNEPNMNGSSAGSSSSNNPSPTRFNNLKGGRFYDGMPNLSNSLPSINYITGENIMRVLPVQDTMEEKIDKIPSQIRMPEVDPVPWPVRLGTIPQKASLYEIRGHIIKFDPGTNIPPKANSVFLKKQNSENAELEVKILLIQNKTGRIIKEQDFKSVSSSGVRPFSEEIDLHRYNWRKKEPSSMSLALSALSGDIASYVNKSIIGFALEGDIISVKNKDVLINIGKQNGVEVGDKFRVFSIGLALNDPLTEDDLGDIYVKLGVIQVTDSMRGFSRAIAIVGKDFLPGNVVRSFKKPNRRFNEAYQQ